MTLLFSREEGKLGSNQQQDLTDLLHIGLLLYSQIVAAICIQMQLTSVDFNSLTSLSLC